jgi:hypothetical protein
MIEYVQNCGSYINIPVAYWLRYNAASWKVAGSRPDEVVQFYGFIILPTCHCSCKICRVFNLKSKEKQT